MTYNALSYTNRISQPNAQSLSVKDSSKNNIDNFWEGLDYLTTKFGLGFVQSVEGIWDFTAGGIADLFGADKWAERQFANDWVNYNKADEKYDAEGGWKLAGDIAGGIGSSAPALLTAIGAGAAVYFTGGAAAPVAIKAVAAAAAPLIAGLGAAGVATKEAYQETGNLDAKAYGYGALVGATEAGIEYITQGIGTGTGRVFKNIASSSAKSAAKATAKEVAETATKRGISSIAKQLGTDFLSEGFEEGIAEFLAPVYQRMTYDTNAEMATAEEIGYAALVGGISGILMAGAGSGIATSINNGSNLINGNKLAAEPQKAADVVATARNFAKKESENPTGYGAMQKIRETVEAYDKAVQTRGADSSRAKMLLGEMNALNTAVTFSPYAERAAMQILQNPDAYAQHIQAYGITDANGNPINISAEKLTEGIDMSDMTSKQGRKNFVQSVRKALSDNKYLQLVASMETAGNLIADKKSILKAMKEGETFKSDAEYQQFIERTSREDRKQLAEILGAKSVEDIEKLQASDVNDLIRLRKEYYANSGAVDYVSARNKKATEIPSSIDSSLENGTYHYKSGKREIAIRKTDSGFSIYDYNTDMIADNLTLDEVNDILRKNSERASIGETGTKKSSVKSPKKAVQKTENVIKETFKLAKEVRGYEKLDSNSQASVRGVIRQALRNGIAQDVALDIANVSARSGAKINIDQNQCLRFKKDGSPYYINGFYSDGEITLNPESAKNMDVLMIHELLHNLIAGKTKKGAKSYKKLAKLAFKNLPEAEQKKIRDRYEGYYKDDIEQKKMTEAEVDEIIDEEIVTHYAETLTNKAFLRELFKEDVSTIERIVDYFTLAKDEYSGSEKLSRSAKKFLKSYKKMFDEFSAQNVNSNAYGQNSAYGGERLSFSSIAKTFFGDENMTAKEFEEANYKETQGYKDYLNECLSNMKQSRKNFNEAEATKEIENSIEGIVKVAVAMKKAGYDIYDDAMQRDKRDSKKRLLFSSLEPNSDYFTSSDISTICDKRKNFAEIYDEIVRKEEALKVPKGKRFFSNVDNYFYIHKVLADMGLTQPCKECYVESMRKNLAPMANAFIELVGETDPNNKSNPQLYSQSGKTKGELKSGNAKIREGVRELLDHYEKDISYLDVETLTTEKGLATLKIQTPLLYEAFNSFYGQSKPKMPRGATPFRFGELTALLTDNNGKINQKLVDKINHTGGFRLQSYSDFQIQNFADVLQVIFEAGTLGLNGHAYTKVPAFLDATKGTNLKRNISVFMYEDGGKWRIDKNDSFPMELEEIYKLVDDDKSGNTGIIVVSQNADNSAWIMANSKIAYGIPFHKSGIKMGVVRDTIVRDGKREVKGYKNVKDHTKQQSEVYATTSEDHKIYSKVKNPIDIYSIWDFENVDNLSERDLIVKNIKAYIDACKDAGYIPKFREYIRDNTSVLNKVLEYSKELGEVFEDATIADISFEYRGYTIPYGYYKFLGDFAMFTPDGKASPQKVLSLDDYNFKAAVEFFSDAESLRRNEILQQFANGEERQKYRESDMDAETLTDIVKQKRTEVVKRIVERNMKGERASLPDADVESPTLSNVNKEREKAELSKKAQANTWLENFYIQAVNETYGIEKFLKQSSSVSEVQAVIQQARAARTQAQSMLGNTQYNIFTKKKIGKGLTKIFEHIEKADKKTEFEDYSLHLLNIDRMTLRERSIEENDRNLVKLSEKESRRNSLEKKILALEKRIKKLGRTKEDMQIKTNLRKTLIERSTELGALKKEIKALHKLTDNFVPLENKPVFGENAERANAITAEESRKIVEKYEKANPNFKQVHKELRAFLDGLLDMRLEAGLISRESYDLMKKLYPNYVPSYRDSSYSGVSPIRGKNDKQISSTIRSAKGGGQDILDIKTVIAEQVKETVSAMQLNRVANAVYETALKDKTNAFVEIVESEKSKKSKQDEVYESNGKSVEIRPKNSQITFYVDGKKTTISVTKEIFMGFEGLNSPSVDHNNTITKTLSKINKSYTSLLTSLNPLFSVRNIIRDLQDAGLNSKHPALFAKNLPKAVQMMASNSEQWQLYQSMGGYASSIFDGETFARVGKLGFEMFKPLIDQTADGNIDKVKSAIENLVKNVVLPIEVANAFIEQIPRFSEFLASIESGDSVEVAINNSAEVTTNFGRRGRTGKVLNSTVMPFLNAAIQGFDKIFRNVSDAFHAGDIKEIIKALAQLLVKALIIGVAPMLLNIFMYGDDEDYQMLRDDLKEAYFLVKISDGKFIRIPRGRLAGVIGGLANRTYIASKGEDPDIEGYLSDVISNITPAENVSRTIFSPLSDAAKNKTWYGGEIEGREWDDTAPQDRYDESTSSIAIAIGKVTGWSPKKIHYVLDQYSGVIGDFVLPATTEKAETNVFEYNFTTDSVSSNKLSTQFYDLYEETQYAKTAGDDTAIYQLKRLNEVKRAVSEMQKEKKAIQSDTTLSSAEKLQKTRTIQILINEAFKSAIADYEAFGDAARETAKYYFGATNEETYEKLRYVAATRMVYGSEQALKVYNSDVYEKSTLLSKIGITYDTYYDYYFGIKDITADLDKNGNAIEGSRRTKTIKAINKMNLSQQQKLLLICASGYALKDGDIKGLSAINAKKRLLRYILNSKLTLAEKEEIAKMCGFTVKNGKIILKTV